MNILNMRSHSSGVANNQKVNFNPKDSFKKNIGQFFWMVYANQFSILCTEIETILVVYPVYYELTEHITWRAARKVQKNCNCGCSGNWLRRVRRTPGCAGRPLCLFEPSRTVTWTPPSPLLHPACRLPLPYPSRRPRHHANSLRSVLKDLGNPGYTEKQNRKYSC